MSRTHDVLVALNLDSTEQQRHDAATDLARQQEHVHQLHIPAHKEETPSLDHTVSSFEPNAYTNIVRKVFVRVSTSQVGRGKISK